LRLSKSPPKNFVSDDAPAPVEKPEAIRGFLLPEARTRASHAEFINHICRHGPTIACRCCTIVRDRIDRRIAAVRYSVQLWQAYQDDVRSFGAVIGILKFAKLHADRWKVAKLKTTRAMDDALLGADTPETRGIA
jgi:hypothetical protein